MSRPPVIESIPEAVMKQGRTVAGMARECQKALRISVETLKRLESTITDESEKKRLAEYLKDPTFNPAAESGVGDTSESKPPTERDRLLGKLTRALKDFSEADIERVIKIAKLQRAPVPA